MRTTIRTCVLVSSIMVCLLGIAFSNGVGAENSSPTRLTFVSVRPKDDPITQWLILIYTEALRRMDIEFEFKEVPPKRASVYSDNGVVDGELGRVSTYDKTHPNMIRVEEHNNLVIFSAFASDPKDKIMKYFLDTNICMVYCRICVSKQLNSCYE